MSFLIATDDFLKAMNYVCKMCWNGIKLTFKDLKSRYMHVHDIWLNAG